MFSFGPFSASGIERPSLLFNFATDQSLVSMIGGVTLTYTGGGGALTYFNSSGILQTAANNVAAFDYGYPTPAQTSLGLSLWEARTNIVLWNRDLTNAAWTASNVTVAKTQTGIDGSVNSASSLTATVGNGTVLQAITLASSARFQTAYVKRITGSGVVDMTMDNGATWTTVTVTSNWTRVSIPTQTLANPTVGFRIVTSGDAIAVDYVQNENGDFATPAIAVTTVAVTRTATVCTTTNLGWYNTTQGTFSTTSISMGTGATNPSVMVDDGTANNRIRQSFSGVTPKPGSRVTDGGVEQATQVSPQTISIGVQIKAANSWAANLFNFAANGQIAAEDTAGTIPSGLTALGVGSTNVSVNVLNGWLASLAYYQQRLQPGQLLAMTT